jgi:hypothetical protein
VTIKGATTGCPASLFFVCTGPSEHLTNRIITSSARRTRTSNQPVTLVLTFPQGVDYLIIRIRLGRRALWELLAWLLIPSLCTFPATNRHSLGLAQDHHCASAHAGFPEFTRFFTARYRAMLLDHASQRESLRDNSGREDATRTCSLQPVALPIELSRNIQLRRYYSRNPKSSQQIDAPFITHNVRGGISSAPLRRITIPDNRAAYDCAAGDVICGALSLQSAECARA